MIRFSWDDKKKNGVSFDKAETVFYRSSKTRHRISPSVLMKGLFHAKNVRRLIRLSILLALFAVTSTDAHGGVWYMRGMLGADWSLAADFSDRECGSSRPAALFGCGPGSDGKSIGAYGDFGSFLVMEAAAGVYVQPWLRTDLSIAYRPNMSYKGQANFRNVPGEQPVSSKAESLSAMINCFIEFSELTGARLGRFHPYVGAGAGLAYHRLEKMVYAFPGLNIHKISITPPGEKLDFSYSLSAGLGILLTERLMLDISYHYTDLGRVRTERGNMYMNHVPSGVQIEETSAPLKTRGFLVGFRYHFR
jgi:opacity protein-like surface antigen